MTATRTVLSAAVGIQFAGMAGAEIATPRGVEACRSALDRHGVVVYREAHISDEDLVALARMLGTAVIPRVTGEHEYPEVSTITLDPAKSPLARYREGTFFWHIDGSTDDLPQKATLLTARVVAAEGGDTEFASTYAAYEALSDTDKTELARLRVVHSLAVSQLLAHPEASAEQRAAWEQVPSRTHPLVWKRRDGRRSLLLGSTAGEVVGMPPDEGRALLDRLLDWATQDRFVIRHRWHEGDLVVFDNTGLLHRATPYTRDSQRMMHRVTLVGEESIT
jgi:alpha-ketoglutarate-dependent taurine dioxygenase